MSNEKLVEAAENVRKFLALRSTLSGADPETIYAVGGPDGELVELRATDLVALVRAQLGPDAVVVSPKRQRRVRAYDYTEALRSVATVQHADDSEED